MTDVRQMSSGEWARPTTMARSILLALLLTVALVSSAPADTFVPFETGTLSDSEWQAVYGWAVAWNGSRYRNICVEGCAEDDRLDPPEAEILALRQAIRRHRSCFLDLWAVQRISELFAASRALANASADRWIPLRRQNLADAEWAAVKQQIVVAGRLAGIDYPLQILAHLDPPTMANAWSEIRRTMVRSARHDFDGDGKPEIVFVLDHPDACRNESEWESCAAYVLTRRTAGWELAATLPFDRKQQGLCGAAAQVGRPVPAFSRNSLLWPNAGRFVVLPLDARLQLAIPPVGDEILRREEKFLDQLRALYQCRHASAAR